MPDQIRYGVTYPPDAPHPVHGQHGMPAFTCRDVAEREAARTPGAGVYETAVTVPPKMGRRYTTR